MDSVVLLALLRDMHARAEIVLTAVHVHHGLSPNADNWATFCEELCRANGVHLTLTRVSVDRTSSVGLEAAAREARYVAFKAVDADFLALAQHADDQAETVLHQLLRGTGLKGLAGMGETRVLREGLVLLRPLLRVTRAEIEAFASAQEMNWIEDESNADIAYTRNFIRHEVVPKLADRFPHYRESLARAASHATESDQMLSELARVDLRWDGQVARADDLDRLSAARQVNALYHWLSWQALTPPSRAQLVEWAQQLFRESPRDKPHTAGGHDYIIRRTKNVLKVVPK